MSVESIYTVMQLSVHVCFLLIYQYCVLARFEILTLSLHLKAVDLAEFPERRGNLLEAYTSGPGQ